MNFDNQLRAIRYAIKNLQRERVKAIETKDKEWETEVEQFIFDLTQSLETIQAMKALKSVIGSVIS